MATDKRSDDPQPHILVVDSDRSLTSVLSAALRAEGFRVSFAHDGNHAIAIAETHAPDLLILDLLMPRRSGFLVMEHLILHTELLVPIIVTTDNKGNRHRTYAELLGAADFILKPLEVRRVIESVKRLLDSDRFRQRI